MFVILCVIAGATSHSISNNNNINTTTNSRKLPVQTISNRYRASFFGFILDTDVINSLQSSNLISETWPKSMDNLQPQARRPPMAEVGDKSESKDVCVLLSSMLNAHQIKFCQQHQDILEFVLPKVINLTKKECARITRKLRWNCTVLEPFLDRSKSICRYQCERMNHVNQTTY